MGRDLHPQVAPGHHHAVSHLDDVQQVVHALPVLDLGDDADVVPAVLVQALPDVPDVAGLADEGGGNEVKVVLRAELQILPVFLGEGGQQDVHAGDVDGLVAGQGAAVVHRAQNVVAPDLPDAQLDEAVVHQHPVARLELLVEVLVGDGHPPPVAGHVVGGQGKVLPPFQSDGALFKGLNADLRPLGVQNGGHRDPHLVPDALELGQLGQVTLMGAVGKIKAGGVHARTNQLADDLLAVHCGPQGTDNLGLSHKM